MLYFLSCENISNDIMKTKSFNAMRNIKRYEILKKM